jgi:signal transduction histidine kinase
MKNALLQLGAVAEARIPTGVAGMPRLSTFIRDNTEEILSEWEMFARGLPTVATMDIAALRDHAEEMLLTIARDLDMPQTRGEQSGKGKGESDAGVQGVGTAAQEHGTGRAESGFTVEQMVSEFRALRASVIYLWMRRQPIGGNTDIEDMTRFNEAVDQAIAESIGRFAQEVAQSKERFLAILGHDLRTPLGSIIMSSRFMLDTAHDAHDLGEPYLMLITRMASTARRMNQMVTDLLEFTRTRFGDVIPIVASEADLRKVIEEVVQEVSASYPNTTVHIETEGNLRGVWDADRLSQAFTNLVANAVQHGAKAPVKIAGRVVEDEVVISVHNDGAVIADEDLGTLFDAMKHRKGKQTSDARHHLGLGLYIAQKIISAHRGTIDVRSSKELGTTFMVRLPANAHPSAS